MNYKKKIILL